MNNVVQRALTLTADWQPLATQDEMASVDIQAPPSNAGLVYFRGDNGTAVPWIPGEYHTFFRVNLRDFQVRGTPGDLVTVIGGTW